RPPPPVHGSPSRASGFRVTGRTRLLAATRDRDLAFEGAVDFEAEPAGVESAFRRATDPETVEGVVRL
ncbi:hypothetical protein BRC60_04605, partial [Halobacteriales archaeon QH_1_68_42]